MKHSTQESGFSLVEIVITTVIVSTLFIGISQAFQNVARTYMLARQLNEMYAVLSSCPEIDRALQYESLGSVSCFPNNVFESEGPGGGTITYTPTVSVQATSALPVSDPLYNIADSKVVDISVARPYTTDTPWKVRLMVTRNGIGQQ